MCDYFWAAQTLELSGLWLHLKNVSARTGHESNNQERKSFV